MSEHKGILPKYSKSAIKDDNHRLLFDYIVKCEHVGPEKRINLESLNNSVDPVIYHEVRKEDIVGFIKQSLAKKDILHERIKRLMREEKHNWDNFRKAGYLVKNKNSISFKNPSEEHTRVGFCATAQLTRTTLEKFMVEFFEYCDYNNLKISELIKHKGIIRQLIKKVRNPNETRISADNTLTKDQTNLTEFSLESLLDIDNFYHRSQIYLTPPPINEGNLSYYGNRIIEVLGRENQKHTLRQFLTCDKRFAWFQLAGVAGQGKSRLALDLVEEASKYGHWAAGLLENEEIKRMEGKWQHWQPKKPHLLVLDYVIGRTDIIAPLLQTLSRRRQSFQQPVRLLVLERQPWNRGIQHQENSPGFSDASSRVMTVSESRAEWFLKLTKRPDGNDREIMEAQFKPGVLELKNLEGPVLVDIVKQVAEKTHNNQWECSNDSMDSKIQDRLREIDRDGRPLYAYFLALALASGADIKKWSRDDLLDATLERELFTWWSACFEGNPPNLGEDTLGMRIAVLATMTNGFNCNKAHEEELVPKISDDIRREAIALNGGLLSKGKSAPGSKVSAMQPDLLAEWFVISCFSGSIPINELTKIAWQYSPEYMSSFLQRLCQDFWGNDVITEILENIKLNQISTNILSKISDALLIHFHSKKSLIPKKVVDALHINAERGTTSSMKNLSYYYRFYCKTPNIIEAQKWLSKAAILGEIEAMAELGAYHTDRTLTNQDYHEASYWSEKAANAGNLDAMFTLGFLFDNGYGVKRNQTKAAQWYELAAKQGHPRAMYQLGLCYEFGHGVKRSHIKALGFYELAAKNNEVQSNYHLGFLYEKGIFLRKNSVKAIEFLKKAAKLGNEVAMYELSRMYFYGRKDVNRNIDLSVNWLMKSAELEHPEAMADLGTFYAQGEGVKRCIKKSLFWTQKAADKNHAHSIGIIGLAFQNGDEEGYKKDEKKALKLFKKAVGLGDGDAMAYLGKKYITEKSRKEDAMKLFKEGVKRGSSVAMNSLGCCYYQGDGVKKNNKKALRYLQMGATLGDGEAMANLGQCYGYGEVVDQNIELAILWIKKSIENGCDEANQYMEEFTSLQTN